MKWIIKKWAIYSMKGVSEWSSEKSEWKKWMSERAREWVCDWMSEWVSEWENE